MGLAKWISEGFLTVYGVLSCREEVSGLHNGNPVLTFLPSLVISKSVANCAICP
jgi:hypothetical protein